MKLTWWKLANILQNDHKTMLKYITVLSHKISFKKTSLGISIHKLGTQAQHQAKSKSNTFVQRGLALCGFQQLL